MSLTQSEFHSEFRADLHCHTTCSDGSMTPAEIVRHAKAIGLAGLSITDHDTIAAYAVAVDEAKRVGLSLGTGVEFSSFCHNQSIHVLGYNYSLHSREMQAFCLLHKQRRRDRNRLLLHHLAKRNMPITEEELSALGENTGRPHIAKLMVEKRYVGSIQEAFNLYLGEGKSCYEKGAHFTTAETIELIHMAKGKAFLAHPHLLDGQKILKNVLELPFDGIECYYARLFPAQEKRWLKIAKEKRWIVSGGSDFHGDVKPHIPLGCSWVNKETFDTIFSNRPLA